MTANTPFDYEPRDKIGDPDLFGKYRHQWIEENFPHYEKGGQEIKVAATRTFLGASLAPEKIVILLLIAIVGVIVIFGRVFYIQVLRSDYYRQLAENNRVRNKSIPAERGLAYDRFGQQLIENIPSFSLSVVPQDLPQNAIDRARVIEQIANISGVNIEEIEGLIKKYSAFSYESLTVKDNLDYESAISLYIQNANLPGIVIEKGTKRLYRDSFGDSEIPIPSLSHLLGYLGKIDEKELAELSPKGYLPSDYLGKSGLEKQYESSLRGVYGRKKIEVNALGREQNVLAEEPPIPGRNLILSIDLEAQQKMESLLRSALDKLKLKRAVGIAMNPESGEVLAMVSLPAFDNNDFSGGISAEKYAGYSENKDGPLFNRAIGGAYPSGSIVKPLIAAAALQENLINRNTSFLSTGGLSVDRWFFKDWKAGGHGYTNVTKALAWSVNTFFYYIGGGYKTFVGLGVDKIVLYLRKFGLAKTTGIDLPGENSGFLPSKIWKEQTKKEQWYVGDTYNLSIGQGDLLVTPLQAAVWTAAVANGGKIVVPKIVNTIFNPVAKKSVTLPVTYENKAFISPQNMETVKQGMRECVVYGSCQLMRNLPFTSGAKTGTAQWSSTKPEHAWFVAFAPFYQPKIVVTILIEEGGEGSVVSMPVAVEFLKWWGTKYLK
jgi:penicillin-binding protein 2